MKKLWFLIIVFCVFITGCGNDTLKCTKQEKNETSNSTYNIIMSFNRGKLVSADIESIFAVSDEYKEFYDVMADRLSDVLKTYENKKGIKTNIESSDSEIKTIVKFNLNKMSEEDKKNIGFDSNGSKKSIKSYYEKEGFSCN